MEQLLKEMKSEYTHRPNVTPCSFTHNIFANVEKNDACSSPLLIEKKQMMSSCSDSKRTSNHITNKSNGMLESIFHTSDSVNHIFEERNHSSLETASFLYDNISRKASPTKQLWVSTDTSMSHPPLLIKSCDFEFSDATERNERTKIKTQCVGHNEVTDKYRHPIFASTEDFKREQVFISRHKWEKHLKHISDYKRSSSATRNGRYVSTLCNNSMLNKNLYIDCGKRNDGMNCKDGFRVRHNDRSPFDLSFHNEPHSFCRQPSSDESNSLLSTTSLRSNSLLSASSREGSPAEEYRESESRRSRKLVSRSSSMSMINFQILEKRDEYITVYAEINGKRYEGRLTIERKR